MDAPTCRLCGKPHWSRLCYGPEDVTPVVTSVTKPVTVTPIVTPDVTPIVTPRTVAPSKLAAAAEIESLNARLAGDPWKEAEALRAENELLREEVVHLKRALTEAGKPKPLTAAERQRVSRERRKQV